MYVELTAGGRVALPAPRGRNVCFYVVRGELTVAGEKTSGFQLLEMNDDGDVIAVEAFADAVLLFGHAVPLREPVVAQGPFVMNTRKEIIQAIRDYQAGRFRGKVSL